MDKGMRFYNIVWQHSEKGFAQSTECTNNRRNLVNQIKSGEVSFDFSDDPEQPQPGTVLKIQEIETPMIEMEWLLKLFTTSGNKQEREAHREQAAYILRLVEKCAARVLLEDGETVIER